MGYAHFDDKHHGGQKGNCPLFYDTEQKHHEDVQRAGAAAMKKIRAENPFLTEAELKVHFSAAVAKDEAERLKGSQQQHLNLHGLDNAARNQAHHRGPVPGPYQPPGVRALPVPAPGPIPPYRPRAHVANEAYRLAAVAPHHRPVENGGMVFRGIDYQGDDFNWGRFPSPAAVANQRVLPPGPYRPAEHAVPEQRRVADFVIPEQLQNAVAPAEPWFPFLLGIGR